MYLAVALYRHGTKLGIMFGVPLFIFCGFQHSIANVITLGVAVQFSWTVLLCALGNFIGAIVAWSFCRGFGDEETEAKTETDTETKAEVAKDSSDKAKKK